MIRLYSPTIWYLFALALCGSKCRRCWSTARLNIEGDIALSRGKRAWDIIDGPAGGLTDRASLIASKVIRSKLRKQVDPELDRLRKLSSVSGLADMTTEDKAYLKTKAREDKARAAIDFERLYLDGDMSQNIFLESGDVIFIPTAGAHDQHERSGREAGFDRP